MTKKLHWNKKELPQRRNFLIAKECFSLFKFPRNLSQPPNEERTLKQSFSDKSLRLPPHFTVNWQRSISFCVWQARRSNKDILYCSTYCRCNLWRRFDLKWNSVLLSWSDLLNIAHFITVTCTFAWNEAANEAHIKCRTSKGEDKSEAADSNEYFPLRPLTFSGSGFHLCLPTANNGSLLLLCELHRPRVDNIQFTAISFGKSSCLIIIASALFVHESLLQYSIK